MAPNQFQKEMGDIYEFQLDDSVYRLNTSAQLKVVSRKVEPPSKVGVLSGRFWRRSGLVVLRPKLK